jgi:AcrR family transcriptional regulator
VPGGGATAGSISALSGDGRRRDEILETASQLFASSGLRTSLQEIADACGIQPGSLYHHFDSKEAIVVELVQRYHAELDRIAEAALKKLEGSDPRLVPEKIVRLGATIAQCAVSHSAAVQFTFYEPPTSAGSEFVQLAGRAPAELKTAMLQTLRVGGSSGFIRADVDLVMLAERVCQTMLHIGLGLFHRYTSVHRVAGLLCEILLRGLAVVPPEDAELDNSNALLAVEQVMRMWDEGDEADEGGRAALIRRVARAEFGRRGYEVTTVRDIASATGLSTGSVYRAIGSKEELLSSIMHSFFERVMAGWTAAFNSDSTTVQKLDALAWLHINVLERFNDEFKIQLAWLRQSPPEVPNPGWSFTAVLSPLKDLLSEGVRSGEIRIQNPSAELSARCLIELTWIPEQIVRGGGKRAALIHARDTVLRGAANRGGRL